MHCFNHPDRTAIGSCKGCCKGLCMECTADLGHGLACKGQHEEMVEIHNTIVDSVGLSNDAEVLLSAEQVAWADIIFVMESAHRTKLSQKYRVHLGDKKIVCLDIPDEFDYMDPALVRLLEARVLPYIRT